MPFLRKIILALSLLFLCACGTQKQQPHVKFADLKHPKREFRGAWLSILWQDQYKKMTVGEMRTYFLKTLDQLQADGINAILFQVRPQADAAYKSKYEPWSAHITGAQGVAPSDGFDPLAFLVSECHQRNIELHAWINPYRVTAGANDKLVDTHLYYRQPERFVMYGGKIYFDPGMPSNRQYICNVVKDIVLHYDVDAIHIDDYFYPYPIAGEVFNDSASFHLYGKPQGYKLNELADWRRSNVNMLMMEIKNTIVKTKPWVRFGVSPFGIYRNKKNTPDGSGSDTNGLQGYDELYGDVKLWVDKGWVDYNIPQLYWEIGHKAADYKTLIEWWSKNTPNRPLYIGQDVHRTMNGIEPSNKSQLTEKIVLSRSMPSVTGNCFWPAYDLTANYKGIEKELRSDFHKYPALIPAYTHMHAKAPRKVQKLQEEYTNTSHLLRWQSNHDQYNPETAQYYVIYRFAKKERIDLDDPSKIVGITRTTTYTLPYEGKRSEYKYVVTAVDAFHNESEGRVKKMKL